MPTFRLRLVCAAAILLALWGPALAQDNAYAARLRELGEARIRAVAQNPLIVAAVEAQNRITADYDAARIDALDKQWLAEVGAAEHPLIDATLGNPASQYLNHVEADAEGLFTEIIVMDAKGLNVAQSAVTTDYWQGDEPKFTETFLVGPDAIHVGPVEEDESTRTFQSQVSLPILDAAGKPIGAISVGVDLSIL